MSKDTALKKSTVLDDPRVAKNADGSLTVTLDSPVAVIAGDDPMATVTLKRLRGRAMVNMLDTEGEGSRLESLILASADMVGPKGEALLDGIEAADFLFLSEVVSTFLKNGQTTGQ
ncbi:hypothetical protein [Acetobacter orientalis]|uniref:hypothetical protein n=1 Tax=Acetobacter orientalis TaxID=146474 RepID=UPI00241C86CF|nr:hypothetical protein [Acetobacter orientalis]